MSLEKLCFFYIPIVLNRTQSESCRVRFLEMEKELVT